MSEQALPTLERSTTRATEMAMWIVDQVRRDGKLPLADAKARIDRLFAPGWFRANGRPVPALARQIGRLGGSSLKVDPKTKAFRRIDSA